MASPSRDGSNLADGFTVIDQFAGRQIPPPQVPCDRFKYGELTLAELNAELLTLTGTRDDDRVLSLYAKHEGVQYPSIIVPGQRDEDEDGVPRRPKSALLQTQKRSAWSVRIDHLQQRLSALLQYSRSLQDSRSWGSYALSLPLSIAATAGAALADTLGLQLTNPSHQLGDGADSPIKAFAWHPYKQVFAVATRDDIVHVYDLNEEAWLPIALEHEFQTGISCMAWKPMSGNTLAVACTNGVCLWSVVTKGESQHSGATGRRGLHGAAGNTSVSILGDGMTPRTTPRADRSALRRGGPLTSTAPTALGRAGWMVYYSYPGHAPVTTLAWDPQGTLLASGSPYDNAIVLWNTATDTPTRVSRAGGGVAILRWAQSGQYVFSASHTGSFRVWETARWTCETWSNLASPVQDAAWSPDGEALVVGERDTSLLHVFEMSSEGGRSGTGGLNTTVGNRSQQHAHTPHHDRMGGRGAGGARRGHRVASAPLTSSASGSKGGHASVKARYLSTHSVAPYRVSQGGQECVAGGLIKEVAWDPTGERIAVSLTTPKDLANVNGDRDMMDTSMGDADDDDVIARPVPSELIAVFATTTTPYIDLAPRGYIRGPPSGGIGRQIGFRNHFPRGALLSACWENGQIGFYPFYFQPDHSFEPSSR